MDEERRGEEREGGEVASLFYGVQSVPIRARRSLSCSGLYSVSESVISVKKP